MNLTEGEETDRVILRDQGERQLLGFRVRLDQFSVSFYSSGAPKEFKSTLTLLKGDQEILTQPIRVNHPLKYQGISFYQASYGVADLKKAILAVRDRDSGREEVISARLGEPTAIPGNTGHFMLSRFEPNFQGMGPALRVFFPEPGRAHESFWILQNHPEVEKSRPGRYQLSIKEIQPRYFSGLQVTQDPGVWVVWAGCFLMIAGFYITFLMVHRRVWVRFSLEGAGTKVEVAGDSHRDRIAFAREWERIVQSLENISPSAKNG
jgi:cytochrome c biogenesis protein